MTNISDNENTMKDTLTDVRRAYRRIFLYQTWIYHIIEHIQERMKLDFHRWGNNMGTAQTDLPQESAWYGIPLYDFKILLLPQDESLKNQWVLDLQFLADKNMIDDSDWPGDIIDDPDWKFLDVIDDPDRMFGSEVEHGNNKSVLRIYLYHRKESAPESEKKAKQEGMYPKVWNDADNSWPTLDRPSEYDGIKAYGMEFDLTKLNDPKGLDETLDEFKKTVSENWDSSKDFFNGCTG